MRIHLSRLRPRAATARHSVLGLSAVVALWAALLSLTVFTPGVAWAEGCQCQRSDCARVTLSADDAPDVGCADSLAGQSLPDSDADGTPDVCDLCPCHPNPLDADTGRLEECPAESTAATSEANTRSSWASDPQDANATHGEAISASARGIQCVNGRLTGVSQHTSSWFLRPTAFTFTRDFDADTTQYAAGALLVRVSNLDSARCVVDEIAGQPVARVTDDPNWYLRLGAFASANLAWGPELSASLGVDAGVDYVPTASIWSFGATVHVASVVFDGELPLHLGVGPRIGLLDVIALTPFVQFDVLHAAQPSYGVWVNFDWGVIEDLGG